MSTVVITGGTGLIGKSLTSALLKRGFEVIILTRQARSFTKAPAGKPETRIPYPVSPKYSYWNIDTGEIEKDAISTADHIIHLAGASVAGKRWTKKRKQEILNSRAKSGKLLAESLKTIPNQLRSVISISGIGYYGPDKQGHAFVESDPPYEDFLARVCQQWESSLQPVTRLGKRLTIFRTGIVLSNTGGAVKEFMKPLRFGLATILGSGKQVISWIHIDDLVNIFIAALENEKYAGIYNAVSPGATTNKELILTLAKTRNKFFLPIHVPAFALRVALGEMSVEVLKSANVSCKKLEDAGYKFQFPNIGSAFQNLIKKDPGSPTLPSGQTSPG